MQSKFTVGSVTDDPFCRYGVFCDGEIYERYVHEDTAQTRCRNLETLHRRCNKIEQQSQRRSSLMGRLIKLFRKY